MAKKAKETHQPAQIAAPAATGGAGPQFEAKVGAFYVLPCCQEASRAACLGPP